MTFRGIGFYAHERDAIVQVLKLAQIVLEKSNDNMLIVPFPYYVATPSSDSASANIARNSQFRNMQISNTGFF